MRHAGLGALALAIALAACQQVPPTATAQTTVQPQPEPKPIIGLAGVERIEPVVLGPDPELVRVVVYGWLPDACTSLDGFDQKTEGNVITIRVLTTRPRDVMCAQVIKRFQETYPVEVEGLAPGTYTLQISGKTAQFDLP
jgi:hypothetical protein